MVIYAYLLWVAVVRLSGCEADGDALWRLLLAAAPVAVVAATLVGLTRPITDVHHLLRWARVPVLLLVPLSMAGLWPTWEHATVAGLAVCGTGDAPLWQSWWAPAQALTVIAVAVVAWRRSGPAARPEA